jgi:hypothetical protein
VRSSEGSQAVGYRARDVAAAPARTAAAPPQGAALTAWLESHRLASAGQDTIWYWPQKNLLSSIDKGQS